MSSTEIGSMDLLTFLSPTGQQEIIALVREAKESRGPNWLTQIKAEFPMFSWIDELIADRTAEEAFAELQKTYPNYPIWTAKDRLINLHGLLEDLRVLPRVHPKNKKRAFQY